MDRVAARPERSLDHDVVAQVAPRGGPRSDAHGSVGGPSGCTAQIDVRGTDDALQTELAARVHDPQRNLAAVGDEHPLHAGATRNSGAPYSTSWPFSWHNSTTVPDIPAGTEFIIFITSMMQTVVSGST